MTTLDDLEKLADAADVIIDSEQAIKLYEDYLLAANPQTIKRLIKRQRELEALCKMQYEALKSPLHEPFGCEEAIAAYEQMNGDE